MSARSTLDALFTTAVQRTVPTPSPVNPELIALSKAHDFDLDFDLEVPLMTFQRAGVAYCLRQRRVILGDAMGLGKTPQLIAVAVKAHEEGMRSLIVCPPSLREMWRRSISMFTGNRLSVEILTGSTPFDLSKVRTDVVVIGSATLNAWQDELESQGFGALLVDEAHHFKTEKAQRTKALRVIARSVPESGYVVLASGTPAVNRPVELVSLLDILGVMQPLFKSAGSFKWRYCDPVKNQFGYSFSGVSNAEELHEKLRGACMVRRLKEDVLTELPPKRQAQLAIPLSSSALREYTRIEQDFLSWVFDKGGREAVLKASRAETITKLTAMRQALAVAKVPAALEHLESIIESGEPVVVFAHHRKVIETVIAECQRRSATDPRWNVVSVIGGMTDEQKQSAVDDFQSGRASVFVGNYAAAGVGLTLTRANQWVGIELPWTPADLQQATDRCHRIGQAEAVTCWHITGARENGELTLDDRLFGLLNSKARVLSSILDGEEQDLGAESGSIVSALLTEWIG